MKVGEAFPSKWLKAADLQGRNRILEISRVEMEEIMDGQEPKPVCYFKGAQKGLVLNKTNAEEIQDITGQSDMDDWRGHSIELYPTYTKFAGKKVDCIRVRRVEEKQTVPERQGTEASDDDIPF